MMKLPRLDTTKVYPSGDARATCSCPTMPPAPGRCSTTTGWAGTGPSRAATRRASRSAVPAAENGTTSLIGRLGQLSAATVGAATIPAHNTNAMRSIRMLLRLLRPPHGFLSYLRALMIMQRATRCDIDRPPAPWRGLRECDEVLAVNA